MKVFTGISLDIPVKEEIFALYAGEDRKLKWAKKDNLHITLKYIGEIAADRLDLLKTKLGGISYPPFDLSFHGVSYFHHHGKLILWAAPEKSPQLEELQRKVEDQLHGFNLPPEAGVYHPHVTILRAAKKKPDDFREFLEKSRNFKGGPLPVRSFHIFASVNGTNGIEYPIIHSFPLKPVSE